MLLIGAARLSAAEPDYSELVKKSILHDYPGMLHPPTGTLAYPFVTPGSVYASELWDWDSWLSDVALCQIMTDEGQAGDKAKMVSYGEGCVLNFLKAAKADGSIPIRIRVECQACSDYADSDAGGDAASRAAEYA